MRRQPSSFHDRETHLASSSKHASASPEAKLFYYRGPSRRIPSPTNILSIDRRDYDENDGGDSHIYPPQPPVRRPTNNVTRQAQGATSGVGVPRNAAKREEKSDYFFYDPSWVAEDEEGERSQAQLPGSSVTSASPSPRVVQETVKPFYTSAATTRSARLNTHARDLPTSNPRTAFRTSPLPATPSTHLDRAPDSVDLEDTTPNKAAKRRSRRDSEKRTEKESERHLRHLLRRYQRYVEEEVEPQLAELESALRVKTEECTQLHADNVLLTQQIQRIQAGSAAGRAASNAAPTPTPLLSSAHSAEPTFPPTSPFAMAAPVAVTQETHHSVEAEHQLREAAAEVTLLRRQLSTVQGQYDRLVQQLEQGNVMSPVSPGEGILLREQQQQQQNEASRLELVKWCRALSEDGLGFTEALSDVHERLSPARSVSEVSSGRDGVRGSPVRSVNPFKSAVEEWRRFARLTAATLPLPSRNGPASNSTNNTAHNKQTSGRGRSAEGNPLHAGAEDTLTACVTLLKGLASTLQTEHGAVAAGMEAAQQTEKHHLESVRHHQRVVEQVRREAERRIAELEADHEAEVQTLESAMAELEQQVSMTAASRRPWTAGLLIHRRLDGAPLGSPIAANARSSSGSYDAANAAARRESAGRGSGGGGSTGGAGNGAGGPLTSGGQSGAGSAGGQDLYDNARRGVAAGEGRTAATAAAVASASAVHRSHADTQTPLSLELISACLQKAREEPLRPVRREKEAELVELMSTEIEMLRRQLTDSRAVATRLREEQRRFLGDVTLPLSYFDNFSSFPAYV